MTHKLCRSCKNKDLEEVKVRTSHPRRGAVRWSIPILSKWMISERSGWLSVVDGSVAVMILVVDSKAERKEEKEKVWKRSKMSKFYVRRVGKRRHATTLGVRSFPSEPCSTHHPL